MTTDHIPKDFQARESRRFVVGLDYTRKEFKKLYAIFVI